MVGGIPSTILGRPFNRKRMGNGVRPCAAVSGPVIVNICLSQYKEATAGWIPERRRTKAPLLCPSSTQRRLRTRKIAVTAGPETAQIDLAMHRRYRSENR
jgi:hypothetical protein